MPPPAVEAPSRLRSLDALRGFDMAWIVGGSALVAALADATGSGLLRRLEAQLHHVEWHGFTFWDLIFPLFLFIAGVALPYSLGKRLGRGDSRTKLAGHLLRRGLLLVLLGVLYNAKHDASHLRYASVLGRIGLAWMLAGWIVLKTGPRGQALWAAGLLLGYWAAMSWIPVPGHGAGDLAPGASLADWIDRQLLPGRLHRTVRDPEGLLSTVPAVSTALLGALTGHWLRRRELRGELKALGLVAAGVAALALGALWNQVFPVNKNLWTSSFVLWTAGWSLLLLAVFYYVIDVRGRAEWAFPFVVVGSNAIAIYLLHRFVDFQGLVSWIVPSALGQWGAVLAAAGALALEWLVLWWLWRRRWFLRV